jgi:signal transduction histidine kinase
LSRPEPAGPASLDAERLRLVLELGRRVTSILDLDALLPEACRLIAEAFGYDLVGISLVDPLDATRLYQAAAFPPERSLPRSFRVPLGRGLTGWVARTGASLLANDVTREPRYIAGPGRNTQSELDVPLLAGARTIGVLNVESERLGAFAPDDVPYLEGLAAQLAQAIENARLAGRARQLAAAEERARIGRDLHDETIQALVAIGRQVELLALDLEGDNARARQRIEALQTLVDRTLEGVRRLSRNLRPAVLEDLGLVAALRSHAAELGQVGLRVEVVIDGEVRRLPPPIEVAAFRVAQEALSNVARHAGVETARLELAFSPEELVLTITDQGPGIVPVKQYAGDGTGLVNMRDRAAEIGAALQITSSPGQGTTVRLVVPLELTMVDRL